MQRKGMADLNVRLLISSLVLCAVVFLIAFSSYPFVQFLLLGTIVLMASIGIWEYAQLLRAKELEVATSLMIGVAAAEIITFFASIRWIDWPLLPVMVLFLGALLFFLFHFRHRPDALARVAAEFFGVCYIAVPLGFMLGILYPVSHHAVAQDGRWWLFYLIFVTKTTDMAGYFVGRLWGKKQLAPFLSPKKTIEGAVAGSLAAIAASLLIAFLGLAFSQGTFGLTLTASLWLGLLIGVVGQVGDLAESLLKRDADVKDSNALPGLGGVLDMVDSLLFSAPIVYFFIRML